MRIANCTSLLTLVLAVTGTSGHSQGPIFVQHSGYADPLSEGFFRRWGGDAVAGPVTNDLGFDAWFTRISLGGVNYDRSLPDFAGADWTLSVTIRVVSLPTRDDLFSVGVANSSDLLGLHFGSEADGDQTVRVSGAILTPVLTLGGGSSYHTYQLMFNASAGTADLWVDGAERLTGIPPAQAGAGQPAEFGWGGSYQAPADFQANWSLVSLQIPEPWPGSLLALGGLIFLHRLRGLRPRL